MKITRIENDKQKLIMTGLIVSNDFCKEIVPILDYNRSLTFNVFTGAYKTVLSWCIDYYKKYQKAIQTHIQNVYDESYNKVELEEAEYTLISNFLQTLSDSFERQDNFNEKYVIDQAKTFLRKSNLELLKDNITLVLKNNRIDEAEELIQQFRQIQKDTETIEIIDVLEDKNAVVRAINEENERMFRFHGALGSLVGDFLRGDLVSFSAPGKGGKSQWLFQTAIDAILSGLRVVVFSFEMTSNQCLRRLYQMFCGEVDFLPDNMEFIKIDVPYFQNRLIKWKKIRKSGLSSGKTIQKINEIKTMIKGGKLKLITPPAYSMTIKKMSRMLDDLLLDNFVFDVIVVDYADIMYSTENRQEYRHQLDNIWKGLRKIAQEKNCIVFTATHSGRGTYKTDQTEKDIVEDIRKLNHVAAMIALNQNNYDKEHGVIRPAILAHRHKSFNSSKSVVVLHSYRIGKPYLDSRFTDEIDYNIDKDCRS